MPTEMSLFELKELVQKYVKEPWKLSADEKHLLNDYRDRSIAHQTNVSFLVGLLTADSNDIEAIEQAKQKDWQDLTERMRKQGLRFVQTDTVEKDPEIPPDFEIAEQMNNPSDDFIFTLFHKIADQGRYWEKMKDRTQ